jgi:nitrite reductase/ring-hydroxylating ferredoxin subunit
MRRYWIPAFFSSELPHPDCPPIRVGLLGEQLVAFRDSEGRVGLVDEFCAHRGASLFFGRNEECGLRCVYHGWKYDVEGHCIDMPSEPPESNFKHKIRLTAYPCRERGGLVWTYMGPPERMPGLPELEWAIVPEGHRYISKRIQDCNYLQAMEGGIDSSHVSFLHRGDVRVFSARLTRDTAPRFEVHRTAYGLLIGARREWDAETYYWRITQWLMPWYTMIPRFEERPIGGHAWVPIDDEHCWAWSIHWHPDRPLTDAERDDFVGQRRDIHPELIPGTFRPVANKDNDYLIDRELQRSGRSFTGIKSIGIQDQAVQESQGPRFDRTKEHLGTSDTAIINARKRLLEAVEAVAAGQDPPGLDPATHRVRSAGLFLPKTVPFDEGAGDGLLARSPAYELITA